MKGPDVTLTNGRYEFHGPRGSTVLYLADPPEAGWRERATADDSGGPAKTAPRRSWATHRR